MSYSRRAIKDNFRRRRKNGRKGVEEMIRRWRDKMGEMMKELKGMKNWKEELRQVKEEIRKEIREQERLWRGDK